MARLAPGLVRIPDISFISWDRFPGRQVPRLSMLDFAPDLAVEVLSPGNTQQEMDEKLRNYFASGVRLVWYLDPASRTARVYTGPGKCAHLGEEDTLEGGAVVPGFQLAIREWFDRAGRKRGQ